MLRPHRSLLLAVTASSIYSVALAGLVLSAPSNSDELLKDEQHRLEQSTKQFHGGNKAGSASNMVVVGQSSLGERGFNADVWTHEGFAYVGHWGFTDWATGNDRFCPIAPNNGVAVVDATDPANPYGPEVVRRRPAHRVLLREGAIAADGPEELPRPG